MEAEIKWHLLKKIVREEKTENAGREENIYYG